MNPGTPLGLAFASGINAYFPLLALAVSARWLHWQNINPHFAFLASNWCILVLALLTLADVVADKIPFVDHVWDAINTFARPCAGALVAMASAQQLSIPITTGSIAVHLFSSAHTGMNITVPVAGAGLVVLAVIGGLLAAMCHTAKATTRLVSTFTTVGLMNIFLSIGEDILVVIAVFLSFFIPVLMLILLALFLLFLGPLVLRTWSTRPGRVR